MRGLALKWEKWDTVCVEAEIWEREDGVQRILKRKYPFIGRRNGKYALLKYLSTKKVREQLTCYKWLSANEGLACKKITKLQT